MSDIVTTSTPNFFEFNPNHIPFQARLIYDLQRRIDFSLGTHEILCSGSVGSSKSLIGAHIAVKECLENAGSRWVVGRRTLPDLKKTIYTKIIEHLTGDDRLREGRDWFTRETTGEIWFKNKSEMIPHTWADKRYKKARSLELSGCLIEEATESVGDDEQAFVELRQRVSRLPHIKRNMLIYLTNPDSPSHHLYKYFFGKYSPKKHVYFSLTEQNPFLEKSYIQNLYETLPPKEALRMLKGQWVEINTERVYYEYDDNLNYLRRSYTVRPDLPVSIAWDFNIGVNKPMSVAISQYDPASDTFHFFDECVVHGSRTMTILEELSARGVFDLPCFFEIHGDATGEHGTASSLHSNYEIIRKFLAEYKSATVSKLRFEMKVAKSNPPIKTRHNIVNGYCCNALMRRKLFVYEKCQKLNEGMKLTALKKGADYIEDDSKDYQHVTTALGYRVVYTSNNLGMIRGGNY